MDTWTEEQAIRMKLGGNEKAINFFTNQPEYRKNMTIKEQYTSKFASTYMNKLTRVYQRYMEEIANLVSPEANDTDISPSSTSGEIMGNGEGSSHPNSKDTSPTSANSNWENIYLFNADPSNLLDPNQKEFDNITLLRVYRPSKEKNEAFFAKMGRENAQRSEDIPPSQGGKYIGFGSKPLLTEKDLQNQGLARLQRGLSTGWNFLTSTVNSINENVIKPTSTKIRDPQFSQNLGNYAENFKRSLAETAFVAKDQINNAKEQISTAVQHLQRNPNDPTLKKTTTEDMILSTMELNELNDLDLESSSNEEKLEKKPSIVIDYDCIESNDTDVFNYPTNDKKFHTNQPMNNNDFFDRSNSTNSFTSINESLSRAFSISNSNSLTSVKMCKSNKSSRSSMNLSVINSP